MATPDSPNTPETRARYWRRVLRPLLWWLLLVLALYGIRTHQRLMEETRLNFNITLAGRVPVFPATATFDGKPIVSGQKIPLGHHQFAVTLPKGEPYSTNLSVWYGAQELGTIDLKRTLSLLTVTANPPAPLLSIHGPELDIDLTNSPGMTSAVPTDRYVVMSQYAHWARSDEVLVSPGVPASLQIAPRLGAAQITCNEPDATGQFLQADSRVIESVAFPYAIWELPEGNYTVTARHHDDVLTRTVTVTAGTTNRLALEFLYGSAMLETEPPGATVRTADGRYWGATPLKVEELKPGGMTFVLEHDGYEPATAALIITAGQCAGFQTNLISVNYTASMKVAQQAMAAEDYDVALKSVGEALLAKPGDAAAMAMERSATALGSLQRAKKLGQQGDFIGGEKELATALGIFPDNAEAKALLAEFKRREPEQREQMRLARLESGNVAFKNAFAFSPDGDLFTSHEFKTTKPVTEVYPAILNALKIPPAFQIMDNSPLALETYKIKFKQEFSTYLGTSAGYRVGVIICAQTKDDETQVLFKILEYKAEAQIKFSIGNLIGTPGAVNYVPISESRLGPLDEKLQARVNEGITNITARIQAAIGQTPPPSSVPPQ
jgi:PEGA domain